MLGVWLLGESSVCTLPQSDLVPSSVPVPRLLRISSTCSPSSVTGSWADASVLQLHFCCCCYRAMQSLQVGWPQAGRALLWCLMVLDCSGGDQFALRGRLSSLKILTCKCPESPLLCLPCKTLCSFQTPPFVGEHFLEKRVFKKAMTQMEGHCSLEW